MTAKVVGQKLGIVPKATVIILHRMTKGSSASVAPPVGESLLETVLTAANDIAVKGRSGKSVVNMSFGLSRLQSSNQPLVDMFGEPLSSLAISPIIPMLIVSDLPS